MKFFGGLFVGVFLTIAGLTVTAMYLRSPSAQVKRCMALYEPTFGFLSEDENIQAKMKEEGFVNIQDIVRNRCEKFIRNGQKF